MIILDKDMIDYTNGSMSLIEDALKWLLININADIETRKEDLRKKRPGALTTTTEPRLIWSQMIRRPGDTTETDEFNTILEDTIAGDECSHILKVHLNAGTSNFYRMNQISHDGKVCYWRLIDETMKEFDTGEVELILHKQALKQQEQFLDQHKIDDNQNRIRNRNHISRQDRGHSHKHQDGRYQD